MKFMHKKSNMKCNKIRELHKRKKMMPVARIVTVIPIVIGALV